MSDRVISIGRFYGKSHKTFPSKIDVCLYQNKYYVNIFNGENIVGSMECNDLTEIKRMFPTIIFN